MVIKRVIKYCPRIEQRRVVDWLVLKGIAEDRMTFLGYGDTMPLLPNTSVENKAKNRRTELKIQ